MLLKVSVVLVSLISTTYSMDWNQYGDIAQRHQQYLKPDTFVYRPEFLEPVPAGRITLSKIVDLQKQIDDEFPIAPPNSPVMNRMQNTCFGAFLGIIPTLLRGVLMIIRELKL